MEKEKIREFMECFNKEEELQEKAKAAMEAFTGDRKDEKAVFEAVLAPIAKEEGYAFTYEDMAELAKGASEDELSEEELMLAAGGEGMCPVVIGFGYGSGTCDSVGVGACYIFGVGFGTYWK